MASFEPFVSSDAFSMSTFNSKLGGAFGRVDEAIASAGNCKIATGSYVGTNTYGENNPNTLTFDFEPKIVFLTSNYIGTYGQMEYVIFLNPATAATKIMSNYGSAQESQDPWTYPEFVTWGEKSLSWYNPSQAARQMNSQTYTYYYIALG